MQVIQSATQLLEVCQAHRLAGRSIGLVPTMGYLHNGHISLVESLRPKVDILIASIFVNPTQFGPSEDLDAYPRDEQGDLEKLRDAKTDIVFLPTTTEIYQEQGELSLKPPALASRLCGASRPGHFSGVCTIVLKLFQLSRCTDAIFGEKDFQQLQVLRAMNRQLWLGINIHGGEVIREADGLAMSSRNAYLGESERIQARVLSRGLIAAKRAFRDQTQDAPLTHSSLLAVIKSEIPEENPEVIIDYIEVVDPRSLTPTENITESTRVILAVKVGKTRLIDNADLSTNDGLSHHL